MNKAELTEQIAERAGLSRRDAAAALDAVLAVVESELAQGREVALTGFGKFSVTERDARRGRNPSTGEALAIAASRLPKFSAGKTLKQAVAR